jgi:hypothetical protein
LETASAAAQLTPAPMIGGKQRCDMVRHCLFRHQQQVLAENLVNSKPASIEAHSTA